MPRTLPRTLAAVVEELELAQSELVTMDTLRALVARHRIATPANVVAARLRTHGWLLPTPVRGVWEFAPASHAGPVGRGSPTLPLAAARTGRPSLPAALTHSSAAWAHGYADRAPARLDVVLPHGEQPPVALSRATHVTHFDAHLAPVLLKGVPALGAASLVVHLAERPTAVRAWTTVVEWLPELAADLLSETLLVELAGRTAATRVRTGYLLSGLRPDLADLVRSDVGPVVRFGGRNTSLRRHASTWRVNDTALPSDPTTWRDVTP